MYIICPNLSDNKIVSFFTNINNASYRFVFKWIDSCDCCFLDIFDNLGNPINTGNALQTNTTIINDNRILPNFAFLHSKGLALPPTVETLKDYVIAYIA